MKRKLQEKKGITLVALVITIIVLIILAGVSINLVLGDNGILQQAKVAKQSTNLASAKEKLELLLADIKTDIITQEDREIDISDCNKLKNKKDVTSVQELSSSTASVEYLGYTFLVDNHLTIIDVENGTSKKKMVYDRGVTSTEAGEFFGLHEVHSEYSIDTNCLSMNITYQAENSVYIGTKNKIDLTGYTTIKCLVSTGAGMIAPCGNFFYLTLNNEQLSVIGDVFSVYKTSKQIGENQTNYVLEFDIPKDCLNGSYFLGMAACLQNVKVEQLWLEKEERVYLYNRGSVAKEAGQLVGANDTNSQYAINPTYLSMNVTGDGFNGSYIGTDNPIDLTEYKKIKCLVSTGDAAAGAGNYVYLTLNDTKIPTLDRSSVDFSSDLLGTNQTEEILSFTIPEECKNANYYVGIAGCAKDVSVYEIWLVK